jgi:hypothetical protein
LHGLEGASIGTHVLENDLGSKDRSNDGTNSLNGLRQLETELRPLGRTADSNVRVGRDLEGRQARSSKEHGTAETTKAALNSGRPEHECADAVDGQSEDESVAVSKLAQEPTRVRQGADEVSAKVRSLKTRRFTLGDVQRDLEARVEDIEKAVGESPHEEEGGDEDDGDNGLARSQLRSTRDNAVIHALAARLLGDDFDSGWAAALLLVDLLDGGFLRTVHAEELHGGGGWTLVWIKRW